ncbi:jg26551 [Pararge aegeria aegeria]|uniref:Jg26551 protein n=1 Tax=Pararge aegeria aegeria TaxID=348720 RepID=A0A8S4QJW6_9NEOP|nr:jg26551 [Pararge aegeria aegeria]
MNNERVSDYGSTSREAGDKGDVGVLESLVDRRLCNKDNKLVARGRWTQAAKTVELGTPYKRHTYRVDVTHPSVDVIADVFPRKHRKKY